MITREDLDKRMTEKEFQLSVRDIANQLGWIVGFTYDSRHSEPGEPDLRKVHPVMKRVVFAELKTMKGKLSKGRWTKDRRGNNKKWLHGQDEWGEALSSCSGIEYYLWRPSDMEEIISKLTYPPLKGGNK